PAAGSVVPFPGFRDSPAWPPAVGYWLFERLLQVCWFFKPSQPPNPSPLPLSLSLSLQGSPARVNLHHLAVEPGGPPAWNRVSNDQLPGGKSKRGFSQRALKGTSESAPLPRGGRFAADGLKMKSRWRNLGHLANVLKLTYSL